jgi:hypothetical protein
MTDLNDATGLNLEGFLHLLRADFGAWATLALIVVVLGLMAWTSWGSRRALRKCLVLSILAHCGLALYGGSIPVVLLSLRPDRAEQPDRARIRSIKVAPQRDPAAGSGVAGPGLRSGGGSIAPWDRPTGGLALVDAKLPGVKPDFSRAGLVQRTAPAALDPGAAAPESSAPPPPPPESRPEPATTRKDTSPPPSVTAADGSEVAAPVVERVGAAAPVGAGLSSTRLRPERPRGSTVPATAARSPLAVPTDLISPLTVAARGGNGAPAGLAERAAAAAADGAAAPAARAQPAGGDEVAAAEVTREADRPVPASAAPESDVRRRSRPGTALAAAASAGAIDRRRPDPAELGPLAVTRATPSGFTALPDIPGPTGGRPLGDVPEVYRSRLDPNRSALAYRAGATPASEQAVERALDWLARHQDSDGRWNAGTARYDDGTAVKGDNDYTVHCPPGEACFGECMYWEADTAVTGLALLAYLGAGYTQTDGKYAETVGNGIDFLRAVQKPDGDLRGKSRAVGMYCHAMATIALCEAYALTGDERLRAPVERAISFIGRGRARDGLAWRYAPGSDGRPIDAIGDTSILGWVVMALKSGREVGIEVPSGLQTGILGWLRLVGTGHAGGLARYQPAEPVTPTMTAEAWVCRQFLGVGGPGPGSSEAADYLLAHSPKTNTDDPYNLYYWYYGTLAMYQHGGDAWTRWNAEVRDAIVGHQRLQGHATGSWDPDSSTYGSKGGRIYCTALATLSLEVYYRYLRLYDAPQIPPAILAPGRDRTLGRRDAGNPPRPLLPTVSPPR